MASEQQPNTDLQKKTEIVSPESFAFVMNVGHLEDGVEHTLIPGHLIRRATLKEIAVIEQTLQRMVGSWLHNYRYFWRHRWPHPGGTIEILPEIEWRYFVIAFRGFNTTMNNLQYAFDLAPLELEVGFTVLYSDVAGELDYAVNWNEGRLFHVLDEARYSNTFFLDVSARDIEMIRAIHLRLKEHDPRHINMKRLATQLSQLKGLPHKSPLRFLGYFGILESWLTHAPKATDPYDSITRQVKKKVALLDNRWGIRLDYSPFGSTPPETVWSKMYAYRSLVAHGGAPEFTGALAALGNDESALVLVKETVKSVIRYALEEPKLLLDLREC
ncbi:hypothetical protein [uncultured Nitrospira sp.]|uniref:hypothetical protein n=1 Tax=uncultured Nitrospira sp. TaxID=157176 RepID=UPI003140639C